MKISPFFRVLSVSALLLCSLSVTWGYSLESSHWPAGTNVVMQLELGSPKAPLQDGLASWNDSAADAINIWSGYLDFVSFNYLSGSSASKISGDGLNTAFFSNTVFGDDFGGDTLAVTVILDAPGPVVLETTEADVVVNTAYHFDSYRGVEQAGVYDFHRIMLHEFGHVLGLGHQTFNPPGQAIMEPIISDYDHLGADDIAGIESLYGAKILFLPEAVSLRVGDTYSSDTYRANNDATSYSAFGLPPGITINPTTGDISGKATASGVFGAVITAHGPVTDAYGTFPMTVMGFDQMPGLLAILHDTGAPVLADPVRSRIYTQGVDGVGTIDLDTLEYTNLASGSGVAAFRLSISADASTLLYTNLNGSPAQEFKIDLESLTALPAIPIPSNKSAVLEGLNNQAYVAGPSAVHQFDATTGELQNTFAPPASGNALNLALAMSNDRRTLFVTRQYTDGELSTYDISTPTPALIEHVTGSFSLPRPSPDGQYIYAVSDSFDGQSVEQLALPGLTSSKTFATDFFLGGLAVGLNGAPYVDRSSDTFTDDTVQIYDPVSLALTAEIDPNKFNPTMYAYGVSGGVTDSSGKYFLFTVAGYSSEVWVFTTDLANLPPPPGNPTKDLLNVSTRGLVQSGENAMIGGFIVQGNVAKKVLVRGIGPSLPLTGALSNPVMDLYDSSGKLLASNDDWISDRFNIIGSQLAPSSEQEAAILMTLQPGAYTAVVRDRNSQPGLALVEVYDLDPGHSFLGNISTRGKVQTANDVMIGGFIIGGAEPARVLVRALGPSLAPQGVALPLLDPVLELHDGSGNLITSNDNWRATQQADILATGLPPTDDRESAILTTLQPGSYTAVVRGQGNSTGVALVEVYNLDGASASSN